MSDGNGNAHPQGREVIVVQIHPVAGATEGQHKNTLTLVQTIPGLWSRTCSSVAAMSISFTPTGGTRHWAKMNKPGLQTLKN